MTDASGQSSPVRDETERLLRRDLAAGVFAVGGQLPGEPALATRYGVSRVTLRRALARLARAGLVTRRRGKGTFVNARPETFDGRARRVGILVSIDLEAAGTTHFWLRCVHALQQQLGHEQLPSAMYTMPPAAGDAVWADGLDFAGPDFLHALRTGSLSAVVTVGLRPPAALADEAAAHGAACINAGQPAGTPLIPYDDLVTLGVEALLERGCHRLALVYLAAKPASQWRHRFMDALCAHDCLIDPQHIVHINSRQTPAQAGADALRRLWSDAGRRPDGLLLTDELLYHQMEPLLLYNRIAVPDELAIATHATSGAPAQHLPADRIEVDPDLFARRVAEVVQARVAGDDPPTAAIGLRLVQGTGHALDLP